MVASARQLTCGTFAVALLLVAVQHVGGDEAAGSSRLRREASALGVVLLNGVRFHDSITLKVHTTTVVARTIYGSAAKRKAVLEREVPRVWGVSTSGGVLLASLTVTVPTDLEDWEEFVVVATQSVNNGAVTLEIVRPNSGFMAHSLRLNRAVLALVNLVEAETFDVALQPVAGGPRRQIADNLEYGVAGMEVVVFTDDTDLTSQVEVFQSGGYSASGSALVTSYRFLAPLGRISFAVVSGDRNDLNDAPYSVAVATTNGAGSMAVPAGVATTVLVVLASAIFT